MAATPDPRSPDPSALECLTSWLTTLRAEGASAATLAASRKHVRATLADLARELSLTLEELSLSALTPAALQGQVASYRFRPDARYAPARDDALPASPPSERAPASVRARISALRSFTRWGVREELLARDPAERLRPPAQPTPGTPRLRVDEARDVLAAARLARFASRDELVAALCLTMGCTLQEVAGLTLRSLDAPAPGACTLLGRAGTRRVVTISPLVRTCLERYLPERAELLARAGVSTSALLCSARPAGGAALTPAGVGALLSRLIAAAGLASRGVRAHALRATFAALALDSGAYSIPQLQAALGVHSLAAVRALAAPGGDLTLPTASHPLARG